jgi:hypothetical protein
LNVLVIVRTSSLELTIIVMTVASATNEIDGKISTAGGVGWPFARVVDGLGRLSASEEARVVAEDVSTKRVGKAAGVVISSSGVGIISGGLLDVMTGSSLVLACLKIPLV